MRNKVAKRLKKLVYKDDCTKPEYTRYTKPQNGRKGQIISTGNRRVYKSLKSLYKKSN